MTKIALGSGHEDLINIPVKCPPDALLELHDLLVRSQCSLTVLSLVDAGANEQLSAIIALCPYLSDLSIEFNGWTSDDLDTDLGISSLISRMSETHVVEGVNRYILVPDLESLAIKLFSVSSEYIFFIDRQFVKMIVSRVGGESHNPSQLKKLCMTVIGSGWDWDLNASSLDALFALDGNHGFHATLFLDHGDIDTVRTESGYSG